MIDEKLDYWEGRIWSWAGDGGIAAFRGVQSVPRLPHAVP
jgi:hypothetical protein